MKSKQRVTVLSHNKALNANEKSPCTHQKQANCTDKTIEASRCKSLVKYTTGSETLILMIEIFQAQLFSPNKLKV